jgi:hypothetical protein
MDDNFQRDMDTVISCTCGIMAMIWIIVGFI